MFPPSAIISATAFVFPYFASYTIMALTTEMPHWLLHCLLSHRRPLHILEDAGGGSKSPPCPSHVIRQKHKSHHGVQPVVSIEGSNIWNTLHCRHNCIFSSQLSLNSPSQKVPLINQHKCPALNSQAAQFSLHSLGHSCISQHGLTFSSKNLFMDSRNNKNLTCL